MQIVTVFEREAGTGDNELLSIYVNGTLVGQRDVATSNDWAGGEVASGLGVKLGTQRWNGTPLFNTSTVQSYPGSEIDFNIYRLASSGGNPDNTLENILVSPTAIPSPAAAGMALLGLGVLAARRRRG